VTGVVLAIGFVRGERRASAPMVPMRFFGSRVFAAGIAASFLFYAAMYGVVFLWPQFLQVAQGNGPLGAGLRILPWTATLLVFAPIGGQLINRLGERAIIVVGLLAQAVGMAWIGMIASPELAYWQFVAPQILAGAGVSLAMPAAQNAVLGAVAPAELGKASGVFNMLRYLGGAFGIAVEVAAFHLAGSVDSPSAFSAGFTLAIAVSALLSLLGAVGAMALPSRRVAVLTPSTAASGRPG
jgi:MFS family permease